MRPDSGDKKKSAVDILDSKMLPSEMKCSPLIQWLKHSFRQITVQHVRRPKAPYFKISEAAMLVSCVSRAQNN